MSNFILRTQEQANSAQERVADILTATSALIGGVLVLLTVASIF